MRISDWSSDVCSSDLSKARPETKPEAASPHEWRDPETRRELKKAGVWLGLICAIALVVLLIQPLLIIFGGLVFASMLDGGVRLLGKALTAAAIGRRSEEPTSEPQSLMRRSYAVFCLKKKK